MAPMPRAVVAIAVAACGLVAGCTANEATGFDVAVSATNRRLVLSRLADGAGWAVRRKVVICARLGGCGG